MLLNIFLKSILMVFAHMLASQQWTLLILQLCILYLLRYFLCLDTNTHTHNDKHKLKHIHTYIHTHTHTRTYTRAHSKHTVSHINVCMCFSLCSSLCLCVCQCLSKESISASISCKAIKSGGSTTSQLVLIMDVSYNDFLVTRK